MLLNILFLLSSEMNQCGLLKLFAFHSIRHSTESRMTDPHGSVKHRNLGNRHNHGKYLAQSFRVVMSQSFSPMIACKRSERKLDRHRWQGLKEDTKDTHWTRPDGKLCNSKHEISMPFIDAKKYQEGRGEANEPRPLPRKPPLYDARPRSGLDPPRPR